MDRVGGRGSLTKVGSANREVLWTQLTARAGLPRRRVQKGVSVGARYHPEIEKAREKTRSRERASETEAAGRAAALTLFPRYLLVSQFGDTRPSQDEGGMQRESGTRLHRGVDSWSKKKQDIPISIPKFPKEVSGNRCRFPANKHRCIEPIPEISSWSTR